MCRDKEQPYYEALPHSLQPKNYEVSVSFIDVGNSCFDGTVAIYLAAVETTDEVHLNYRDLSVCESGIEVYRGDDLKGQNGLEKGLEKAILIESLTKFEAKEYFVVKLKEQVSAGEGLKVVIRYKGVIQTNMAGFYKSEYKDGNETKCMLSTQFEATDARRAFPCMDEPASKATFDVDVTVREDWTVLGNMPVTSEAQAGSGLKTVKFETTPVMSTYLLAWACGEFEYIESFTNDTYLHGKPLPVRIYTTKGYTEEAKLASSIAPKIVDYFSRIFEIKYPLPKLDLIAVHSFSHNAMENWGLITYRSTALLYSESKSDPSYKQKVAYVVAHELAHQWFGNLVTMKWWDELWLNEGFATWVGFAAVDYLFPEWDIFGGFVSDSLQTALDLDGLRNSHPIEVPVVDALDIDQVFDAISYLKGASTILMLSNYLGKEKFLEGVAKYLNTNKYGNATSSDLWSAVGEISGIKVNEIMESWIKKIGFPVVNVDFDQVNKKVHISQSRFLNEGNVEENENETIWWIPFCFSSGSESEEILSLSTNEFSCDTRQMTLDNPFKDGFLKLNKDSKGVYRVNYSSRTFENSILPFIDRLSATDKVGVLADFASLAMAGYNSTSSFLKLVRKFVESEELKDDYVVWLELGKRLGQLMVTFSGKNDELTKGLTKFGQFVYREKSLEYIALEDIDESNFLKIKLRSEILTHAGLFGVPEAKVYAQKLFDQWVKGIGFHPSLRLFVFSTIASSKDLIDAETFNLLSEEVRNPSSLDSREITLTALGHIGNESLSKTLLTYLSKDDVVPAMDLHFLGKSLTFNVLTRDKFWEYFKENYTVIHKHMSSNMTVFDRFVKVTLCNFSSSQTFEDMKKFFSQRDTHGFERSLHQVLDTIKINYRWYERDHDEVLNWLKANV